MTYALILTIMPLLSGSSSPETLAPAEQLIAELACAVCHSGLPEETDIKDYAPDVFYRGEEAGAALNPTDNKEMEH